MTDNEININGFKLIELLSIENNKIENDVEPESFVGIPKILDLGEVSNLKTDIPDQYGNTIASFCHLDGKKVGLEPKDYKALQNLSIEILKNESINKYADLQFIEKACFNWVIDIYKSKRARVDLLSYIHDIIEEKKADYSFYFKIEALGIKEPFKIGLTEILFFTKDDFDAEYKLENDKKTIERKEFDKLYKDFKNKPLAAIKVMAVKSKAEKVAKKEIDLSLNAIKCFLLHESLQNHIQIFDVDFNFKSSSFTIYLSRNHKINSPLGINMKRKHGVAPVTIDKAKLSKLKSMGLNKLSVFLADKKDSEFYHKIAHLINQFGEAMSTRNLYSRIVKLISFFEGVIIPDQNNRAKGQTYLKKNVLEKLAFKDNTELKAIINRVYNVRDKFLHNRIEIPIDLNDLFNFQKLGLTFILYLVDLNKKINTIKEFVEHFEIK